MRATITVKGLNEVIRRFRRRAYLIDKNSKNVIEQVTREGERLAKSIAPQYTGALREAITHLIFKDNKVGWIISNWPKGDEIPTHIMFEEGTYPNPRDPNTLHFMTKTAEMLRNEFSQRLRIAVSNALRMKG